MYWNKLSASSVGCITTFFFRSTPKAYPHKNIPQPSPLCCFGTDVRQRCSLSAHVIKNKHSTIQLMSYRWVYMSQQDEHELVRQHQLCVFLDKLFIACLAIPRFWSQTFSCRGLYWILMSQKIEYMSLNPYTMVLCIHGCCLDWPPPSTTNDDFDEMERIITSF